jgi:adenosine deaminase
MSAVTDFISKLPKAELHLHIEGTLEPELMFALAAGNGIELPYPSVGQLRSAYTFENLQGFLDLYYQGMSVLQGAQDFYDLTRAYLEKAHAQNVLHAEIFFDPQAHTRRGVPFATVVEGVHGAVSDVGRERGISAKLIMCFLRDLDEAEAMTTLDEALDHQDRIAGVGLDSAELGHPPVKFKRVFERARNEGFLAVAHAGEEGPAEYVRQALDELGVARIDHGNRSLDDDELVARLAAERVPLTVCPLSNMRLGGISDMKLHPLKRMTDKGLFVTVNSDDPAYFGGYVNENYQAVQDALGLSDGDLAELARNSFEASFLEPKTIKDRVAMVDAYVEAS